MSRASAVPIRLVAFLRAINVGGHSVKMDVLTRIFEEMKLADVATFIASGNVIFTSGRQAAELEKQIEETLEEKLGYRVATFLRSTEEVERIALQEPFASEEGTTYIGFLKKPLDAAAERALLALRGDADDIIVHGREIYWLARKTFMESKLSGNILEKTIGAETTLRNRNTVRRIAAKFGR